MNTSPPDKKGGRLLILATREENILKAIYFYRYMTALDVAHLLFSPKSINHVREILSRLAGGADEQKVQYLYRFRVPTKRGAGEGIYTLGSRGRDFLENTVGLPVEWYFRPDYASHLSRSYLAHHLTLTRFLVAATTWAGKQADFRLSQVRTSYELEREPATVTISREGKRETLKVIPDAWVLFERLKRGEHERFFPVLLEIDRGTEDSRKFKQHIRSRIEFIKKGGAYSKIFGTGAVIVAYATTGEQPEYRETRRKTLCAWTQEVLVELNKANWATIFRFHSFTPAELYPNNLAEHPIFSQPVWYQPDSETPVTLFPG